MNCTDCSATLGEGTRFCPACGAAAPKAASRPSQQPAEPAAAPAVLQAETLRSGTQPQARERDSVVPQPLPRDTPVGRLEAPRQDGSGQKGNASGTPTQPAAAWAPDRSASAAPPRTPDAENVGRAPLPPFKGWSFLVPFLLYRLLFSLRRPLVVRTSLRADQLHTSFREVLAGGGGLNRLAAVSNSYARRAQWHVSRDAIDTSRARCRPNGLVSFGAGRFKQLLDITGDELELQTVESRDGSVTATIGPARFTVVYLYLFAFPSMLLYPRAVVKRWKQEDPGLIIAHPLSRSRIAVWAVVLLLLLIVAVG